MYYTYLIRCKDNSLYCGITTDLNRRFTEHFEKSPKGAKYTHTHNPIKLEIAFMSENRSLSSKLEYQIKRLTKDKKENIITTKSLGVLADKINIDNYTLVQEK